MAAAVTINIAEKIIAKLVPEALEKVGNMWGLKHELEVLREIVSKVQVAPDFAEEQYNQSDQIIVWLGKLKDAFYDAQDMLEELNIEAVRRELRGHNEMIKEIRTFFSSSNQIAFKLKMSYKIRAVRERIEAINASRRLHLDKSPKDSRVGRKQRKGEETHSFIRERDILGRDDDKKRDDDKETFLGRDDDKKKVMEFLLYPDVREHVSVLPIVGMGGIGKTALAQYVYDDEMVRKHFDLKVWFCVSNDFDLNKIVKYTIACIKNEEPIEVGTERLQSELRGEIKGRRYLLVLDDLRIRKETWLSFKALLVGGARGSKILITTRLPLVAEVTGTTQTHFLHGLSEKACLDLLMKMACSEGEEIQDSEMLAIAKEIVRKCSRVPLLVQTVGRILFFKKSKHEWLHFKDNELPDVSQRDDELPDVSQRDEPDVSQRDELPDVSQRDDELPDVSQRDELPEVSQRDDELPDVSQREESIKSVLKQSYDHLPLHLKLCFSFCSLFPKDYAIKKQTLVNLWMAAGFIQPSNDSGHLEDIADGYFKDLFRNNFFQDLQTHPVTNEETCKMHGLMLDLVGSVAGTECWVARDDKISIHERTCHIYHGSTFNLMGKFPVSLLKASKLRTFLSVPTNHEMEQREPTSKVDLSQLIQSFKRMRILDLHATIVKKVPRSICMLKHLTYLDLSQNNALKRLPNSITRLHHLQTLNLSGCNSLEELPRGIKKLVSLRNLDIDGCSGLSYMPSGLGQLRSLHRLTRFILPSKKALAKNYCKLGELNGLNDIRGSLSIENLAYVTDSVAQSRDANLIGKHSLTSLILKWGYLDTDDPTIGDRDEDLWDGLRPHSNLQKLTISRYNGESFPKWMMNGHVFSLLYEVRLLRCGRCKCLPQLGQLPHLKYLEIWMLTELEYIESDYPSISTRSFPSLLRLKIRYCGNLKAMPPTPHLEDLVLKEVNLELIEFDLNKLKSLDISQMEFLECLSEECLQSLTSLERFYVSACPHLTSLSVGMQHLRNLVHLSFSNCEELDLSKNEIGSDLYLKGLESLRSVDILGVPKLACLPQWLLQVNNLEQLSIKKCLNLKALPEQIVALQSLQQLEIIQCPLLTSLPKAIGCLKSLDHLRIAGCPELEEKCQKDGGEDWKKIKNIPHITHQLEYYEHHL